MEGLDGKIAEENITGAKKWVRINVPPGQYKVSIGATVAGKRTNTATAIIVKPQEITRSERSPDPRFRCLSDGSGANFLKCMFLSGEKALQILIGQDRGPNFRSGGCVSG